jgi:hypothetical protein
LGKCLRSKAIRNITTHSINGFTNEVESSGSPLTKIQRPAATHRAKNHNNNGPCGKQPCTIQWFADTPIRYTRFSGSPLHNIQRSIRYTRFSGSPLHQIQRFTATQYPAVHPLNRIQRFTAIYNSEFHRYIQDPAVHRDMKSSRSPLQASALIAAVLHDSQKNAQRPMILRSPFCQFHKFDKYHISST